MDENKNTEKNINEVAVDTVSVSDNAPCPDDVADECAPAVAELAALKTEFNELNDKYLRTVAELENTRRRAALDIESRGRASAMNVAKQIFYSPICPFCSNQPRFRLHERMPVCVGRHAANR